jgi:hypothetical protein
VAVNQKTRVAAVALGTVAIFIAGSKIASADDKLLPKSEIQELFERLVNAPQAQSRVFEDQIEKKSGLLITGHLAEQYEGKNVTSLA